MFPRPSGVRSPSAICGWSSWRSSARRFPTLDAMTREEMQRLLVEVWQETRKTVVYVTHNVAEAVYLADRIVIMTPRPGTVKTELRIALPRLRDTLSVEFLEYQRRVIRHLMGRAEPRGLR